MIELILVSIFKRTHIALVQMLHNVQLVEHMNRPAFNFCALMCLYALCV